MSGKAESRILVVAAAVNLLLLVPAGAQAARNLEEVLIEEAVQKLIEAGVQAPHAAVGPLPLAEASRSARPELAARTSGFVCLPTCNVTDGRFLTLAAGPALITLSDPVLNLQIAVPADATSFTLGIFDGDGTESDGSGAFHWDGGFPAPFEYTLFADPAADGSGTTVVEMEPGSPSISSTAMPDNAWRDFTITPGTAAQAPSGNYFYRLKIELTDLLTTTLNNFKIRASNALALQPGSQPFSYYASWSGLADLAIVYPSFPLPIPTTYDGNFVFYFAVPQSQAEVSLWDGDFDRGKFDGTDLDTDDPNTPGAPFLPPWATADASFEGVATGTPPSTGAPPDDRPSVGFGVYQVRPPSIRYDLVAPDARTFPNDNPSGNQEWEEFKVSTAPFDPAEMDHSTGTLLPAGVYRMNVEGVDMQNLNAIFIPYTVLCVDEVGVPCGVLRPFLVGDTVFFDYSADGNQDGNEPGVAGVLVNLVDSFGAVLAATTTDADGHYLFEVEAGTYTVEVDSSNFDAGGPLEGTLSTTGDSITDTVIDDNVLTYDFGYRGLSSLGDRVWLDADADGVQDAGETGINGVVVTLFDSFGNQVASQTTAGDGNYTFGNLPPGTYTVVVDESTLPAGVQPTFDRDGLATPHRATASLGVEESRTDVDFGYSVCGPCEGKVSRLTLQYLGTTSATIRVEAKRGPDRDEVYNGLVAPGGEFTLVGPSSVRPGHAGTLGTEIRIFVNGVHHTTIHTSCSQPIGPGLVSGDFLVLAGASKHSGALCPLDGGGGDGGGGGECGPCEGKVSWLSLEYLGGAPGLVEVTQKKGGVVFSGIVAPGGVFTFQGTDKKGTLGTQIDVTVGGSPNASIHTSCSQPIGPGLVSGDFLVVDGASRNGGLLCPLEDGG